MNPSQLRAPSTPGGRSTVTLIAAVEFAAETLELGLLCGYDCVRMAVSREWDLQGRVFTWEVGGVRKTSSGCTLWNVSALLACIAALTLCGCFGPPPADPGADEPSPQQPVADDLPLEPPVLEPVRPVGARQETADLNDDGVIDNNDVDLFTGSFATAEGDEGFEPAADFDGDGVVTLIDFQIFLELLQ